VRPAPVEEAPRIVGFPGFDSASQAGYGKGTQGNCIGLVVELWTPTEVVFQFGSAYGTFNDWEADPGNNYVIALKGYYWGGVIGYSS